MSQNNIAFGQNADSREGSNEVSREPSPSNLQKQICGADLVKQMSLVSLHRHQGLVGQSFRGITVSMRRLPNTAKSSTVTPTTNMMCCGFAKFFILLLVAGIAVVAPVLLSFSHLTALSSQVDLRGVLSMSTAVVASDVAFNLGEALESVGGPYRYRISSVASFPSKFVLTAVDTPSPQSSTTVDICYWLIPRQLPYLEIARTVSSNGNEERRLVASCGALPATSVASFLNVTLVTLNNLENSTLDVYGGVLDSLGGGGGGGEVTSGFEIFQPNLVIIGVAIFAGVVLCGTAAAAITVETLSTRLRQCTSALQSFSDLRSLEDNFSGNVKAPFEDAVDPLRMTIKKYSLTSK